ncbi:AAA ATPase central domain protein [Beutenbergia cavernae DSM 12333]|uniref:AAA ATPase central domain protein n=1 Tax=Beutenbergia cavernae (strain ATCC BAA-8 / DSM 12333 / CCUG 43141 / JCM 11478 / NBRC 16432 / NCIMB 13614 / HKI 0122) TaxID=471853 RepID=C5C5S4_BEUC1|nr:replication-associated recombination protein A [Beutenbergia cavernae]ACQ80265.1 AAA ATPase central domain protein [Beutenbergia cavernae DSM 12333]
MDLFEAAASDPAGVPAARPDAPLAVRMRPASASEVVGQEHLLEPGAPLRRLTEPADPGAPPPSSVILWGPPGTGKTTLAYLIAHASGRRFVELSAVTAGVRDVRAVIDDARRRLAGGGVETVLFVDEVHRFSKTQQDALLPSVENRWVTLVAATTENPSFSVISPLLSRSLLLTLRPLTEADVARLVDRALDDERGLAGRYTLDDDARAHLLRLAGGDARKALTILEAAAGTAALPGAGDDARGIDLEAVERAVDVAAVRYDRDGDQHYDVTSAFIKSMRGSDVDAALHYLARMVAAGEDPRFIARRIVIAASEEVGMADPTALATAVAAFQAVSFIGLPEARIVLAQAVVHVATAPKSNAAYKAIDEALADVRAGRGGSVPVHLRDTHYAGAERLGHGEGYAYAHDAPHGVAAQRYAPDGLESARYYHPTARGLEGQIGPRLERIREILGGAGRASAPSDAERAAPPAPPAPERADRPDAPGV